MADRGLYVSFREHSCYVFDGKVETLIAKYKAGMYEILTVEGYNLCCVHEWHKILSHRNLRDVRKIERQGLKVDPCECSDECEPCIQGKMSREPRRKI